MKLAKRILLSMTMLLPVHMAAQAPVQGLVVSGLPVPYVGAQNAATDVICAVHADTITGLTCNNQTTDGTTETAFTTTVSIPAGVLSNTTIPLNLGFGIVTGTPPTLTIRVRVNGVSGTTIYANVGSLSTSSTSYKTSEMECKITAAGVASSSTPLFASCVVGTTLGGVQANFTPTSSTITTNVNTVTAITVTITVQWGSATTGNAIYLYSISPL